MSAVAVILFIATVYLFIKGIKLTKRVQELEPFAAIVPESEAKAAAILAEAQQNYDKTLAEAKRKYDETMREAQRLAQSSRANAERDASNMREEADKTLQAAKEDAAQKRQEARDYADKMKVKADETFTNAQAHYARTLEEAQIKAKEIAGDAYEALQRANELSATAKAMKNIIEGYGDQYLVPTYSMLDDLADEFGFTEAGEQLRQARDKSRRMSALSLAADCDYVEANRRQTAIRFVVDAFNGKVDSILSKTKHNNVGTLRQEILDAFAIVNSEGAAFRNARIKQEYFEARLDELKWGVIAFELKERAKEEQRKIKEQMREEAKARKEFERAMREAAKEEDTLRKAMEKAKAEIAKATDEQRAKYEAKLAELQTRLAEAEEKNQRAISMAQQTRRGNVYVISNVGSFGENVYKIGMTRRLEPMDRVRELGDASVPFDFDVHAMIMHDDAPTLEHELHRIFLRQQVNKVNPRKEFFRTEIADIRKAVEEMGIEIHWTLEAEAAQYRETLALEREIKTNSAKEREWLESQKNFERREFLLGDEDEEDAASVQ